MSTYPIYKRSVRYLLPLKPGEEQSETVRLGAPPGLYWSWTGFYDMMLRSEAELDPEKQITTMVDAVREKTPDAIALQPKLKYDRHDTWCLAWFCHYTFDEGRTDAELLRSFEEFVIGKQQFNDKNKTLVTYGDGSRHWREPYCLMGAEDRWRWRGQGDGMPAPCRCADCKASGRTHVNH